VAGTRPEALTDFKTARLAAGLASLLRWWWRELQAIVPKRFRRLFRNRARIFLVDVGERVAIVRRIRANGENEIGRVIIENTDAASRRAQFNVFADRLGSGAKQVIVRLPGDRVLRKVIDLPAAARDNLAEILTLEMDRMTPFAVESVYFTYRIVELERQSKRLIVELLILPRATADPALELVRGWGLSADRLEAQTLEPRAEAPPHDTVDFLPAATAALSPRRRPITLLLAMAALALLAAALYLPLDKQRRAIESLRAEVAIAKSKADAGRRMQQELEQSISQSNFIIDRKLGQPAFVDVLDELTTLLPDNTWLIRIRYYNRELQAFGNSPAASSLVGVLEDSPLFENTQFRAPVTRDPRLGVERFHLGTRITERKDG
jgi:general secretion pathway protein L